MWALGFSVFCRLYEIFPHVGWDHTSWAWIGYRLWGEYSCPNQLQLTLPIHGIHICGFDQLWIENKNFRKFQMQKLNLPCAKHYTESIGMKWYAGTPYCSLYANIGCMQILCYFMQETWAPADLVPVGPSWSQSPWGYPEMTVSPFL